MALSYFRESAAPQDFRISSTESESHYTKCLLCYTIKKNFFCVECIAAGNFQHSSMPYSDRFADKQAKLLRIKSNRKLVQDRCETLLLTKGKHDSLKTEVKQCRDKVELIKLAIEQRKHKIDEKKKELLGLKQYNTELGLKLPRYHKRVSGLGKHALLQDAELQNKVKVFTDNAESLSALRRARIRQLNKYIFPVYMTYDSSDSIEDMEFLQMDSSEESPQPSAESRERLHVVAAWVPADGDLSQAQSCMSVKTEGACLEPAASPAWRAAATLALAAQLVAALAWALDARLPEPLALSEYCSSRAAPLGGRARRVCAACVSLGSRAGVPPPPPRRARAALPLLHALAVAAATDDPALGRVSVPAGAGPAAAAAAWAEAWPGAPPPAAAAAAWAEAWPGAPPPPDDPPEYLSWPEHQTEQVSASPPPPAPGPSLATSLASLWRGWTK